MSRSESSSAPDNPQLSPSSGLFQVTFASSQDVFNLDANISIEAIVSGSIPHVSSRIESVTISPLGTELLNEIRMRDSPETPKPKVAVSSLP